MTDSLLWRCSAIGLLMTEPRSKSEGPLSVGAKTAIRNVAAQELFGVAFEISDRKLEKGHLVEPESLGLFNRVFGRTAVKNTQRRRDAYLTGECDIIDADEIIDLKSAWSAATFPILPDDVPSSQRSLYEWQLRGYMRLWDKPRARIAYCMVDTPEDLIGYEPLTLHVVSHLPEHHRVTAWTIERDADLEAQIVEKVKAARAYYAQVIAEFDRSHRPLVDVPTAQAAPAPAPTTTPAPAEVAEANF